MDVVEKYDKKHKLLYILEELKESNQLALNSNFCEGASIFQKNLPEQAGEYI